MTIAEKPWNVPVSEADEFGGGLESPVKQEEYAAFGQDIGGENPSVCYLVGDNGMGRGDQDLGADLLQKFFQAMTDKCMHPDYVIFVNDGVYMAMAASPLIPYLADIEKRGSKILVSEDSVSFYELGSDLPVGTLGSMSEILIVLHGVDKVVSL